MSETPENQPPVKPLRLGRVGALAVLVFLVGGVSYLLVFGGEDQATEADVLVPVRHIRPFQMIEPQDLGVRRMPVESGREYLHDRERVQGRYALAPLSPDQPITPDRLGPAAPAGLNDAFVFTVQGGAGVSLAGKLSPGDSVDVLAADWAGRIEHAFVLDVRRLGGERWAVTLCVEKPLSPQQAALLAGDGATVVRRPEP
jgi:Flp pilus assembly protein CpaB